jgi:predicted metal-dependent phosphoesterase TrpH
MKEIRLDQHIHSSLSDGKSTDEEIIAKIKSARLDFAVLTDHDNINISLQQKIEQA